MNFKKWFYTEIAYHPAINPSNKQMIISRLRKIITLADSKRGDELKDLAGPRQSMDEVYEDIYETALQMYNVLTNNDLRVAWPMVDALFKRYERIVEEKSTQRSDLHISWENYKRFSDRAGNLLSPIWEMTKDAFEGKQPDEENYGQI